MRVLQAQCQPGLEKSWFRFAAELESAGGLLKNGRD